jgi:hypothetical protein
LRDGDPHGMAKMMLDDILGPRGNEMMPRPEKRNGLWKQSGEWPLQLQEVWEGHVVKVSSRAHEIMRNVNGMNSSGGTGRAEESKDGSNKSHVFNIGDRVEFCPPPKTMHNKNRRRPLEPMVISGQILSMNEDDTMNVMWCVSKFKKFENVVNCSRLCHYTRL